MHALVVRATIHNADRTREVLNSQVVPQASSAPGFKSGYWTWSTGEGQLNVLGCVYDSDWPFVAVDYAPRAQSSSSSV